MQTKHRRTQAPPKLRNNVFFRVFGVFFGTSALLVLTTFYLTSRDQTQGELLKQLGPELAKSMMDAHRDGSQRALDEIHDQIRQTHKINIYLVLEGQILGTRPMPGEVKTWVRSLNAGVKGQMGFPDGSRVLALPVGKSSTESEHAVLFVREFSDPNKSRTHLLRLQLIGLLVTVCLAGWFVASAISKPVQSIRDSVNQLTNGTLTARVGSSLKSNLDDFVTLANDIDKMAGRIQNLIESRDKLLQHLSHEMRSPLAWLRILIDLIRTTSSRSSANPLDRLDEADAEISRLDSIIDEILSLAQIEANQAPLMTEISLHSVINDCVRLAALEAASKTVSLTTSNMNPKLDAIIIGNYQLITRALDNLLRNAIRFSPNEGRVSINLQSGSESVLLSVSDQGSGVPETQLEKIFEPFARIESSSRSVEAPCHQGYGLGLAYVRAIANIHGATTAAANLESGGLIVTIAFKNREMGNSATASFAATRV
jgi:two-component system, OmpR family, sensor histidine kinase CpxA